MVPSFGIVLDALLLVLGCWWCYAMAGRRRRDLAEFRTTKDRTVKQVLIAFWAFTAFVALCVLNFFVNLVRVFV